jgi:hypothetical protein
VPGFARSLGIKRSSLKEALATIMIIISDSFYGYQKFTILADNAPLNKETTITEVNTIVSCNQQ